MNERARKRHWSIATAFSCGLGLAIALVWVLGTPTRNAQAAAPRLTESTLVSINPDVNQVIASMPAAAMSPALVVLGFDNSTSVDQSTLDANLRFGAELLGFYSQESLAEAWWYGDVPPEELVSVTGVVTAAAVISAQQGTVPSGGSTHLLEYLQVAQATCEAYPGFYCRVGSLGDGCSLDIPEIETQITAMRDQGIDVFYVDGQQECTSLRTIFGEDYVLAPPAVPRDLNEPPVAQDDSYSTNEDETLIIWAPGLLENDWDPEGGLLTATLFVSPTFGNAYVAVSGTFAYTGASNWFGVDSFVYLVTDASGLTDTATVVITVTPASIPTYTLTIAVAGGGKGVVTPSVGVYTYAEGEIVTLTATADTDSYSTFEGWSGDIVTTANPVSITMDTDKSVTASFGCAPDAYEPDDDYLEAYHRGRRIVPGEVQVHNLINLDPAIPDQDWTMYHMRRWRGIYTFTIQPLSGSLPITAGLQWGATPLPETEVNNFDDPTKGVTLTRLIECTSVEICGWHLYVKSPTPGSCGTEYEMGLEEKRLSWPLKSVTIHGPTNGQPGAYTFTSSYEPWPYAAKPISYTWSPEPISGQGIASASYQWPAPGVFTITLTASNPAGVFVTDTHRIAVESEPAASIYLPLVTRNYEHH